MRHSILMLFLSLGLLWSTMVKANIFSLTSSTLSGKSAVPVEYTCDGKDISPPLSWSNAPADTQSFALIFSDPDAPAGTWYHWVIYNIPNTTTQLDEEISKLPAGALLGKNSWNAARYNGPCPPKDQTHRYIFTLYALDTTLSLPAGTSAADVLAAMEKHILQQAELSLIFSH